MRAVTVAHIADRVFDDPVDARSTATFLADPRHHLVVATEANEVGVADRCRGRGIATDMLRLMLATGRELGCSEAWVLTDRDNTAARKLYASVDGARSQEDLVMYSFPLTPSSD